MSVLGDEVVTCDFTKQLMSHVGRSGVCGLDGVTWAVSSEVEGI